MIMGNIIRQENDAHNMNHLTTKPRKDYGISDMENINRWERNILKILVTTGRADKYALLRGTLFDINKLETTLEELQDKGLVEKTEENGSNLYQYISN